MNTDPLENDPDLGDLVRTSDRQLEDAGLKDPKR
jgi:hypothetical protein